MAKSHSEKERQKEMKELKEDLGNLERYIEELSEFLPLPFCAVNPLSIIIDANKALKALAVYEEQQLIGEEIEVLFKDKSQIRKAFNNALKGELVRNKEMTLITEEEKEIPVNVSTAARKDGEGNVIGVFVTMFDISEIKQFQENLEKKVEERTKELKEAKEKLEESEKILKVRVRARTRELRELNESLEEKVQERTKELQKRKEELQDRVKELEKFHKATVGRELKMIELKKENKELKEKLEEAKKKIEKLKEKEEE